jgi:MerR family mercuric resistance operon transcriptional regulator
MKVSYPKPKKALTLYLGTGCRIQVEVKDMRSLTTGELAEKTGVNIETVRYYERRGLIMEPPRTESGYRQFPPETVQRIRFIKRAQELGFTLNEIEQLLSIADGDGSRCEDVYEFTIGKVQEIEERIRHLQRLKAVLAELAESCPHKGPIEKCPIIESLIEKGKE